MALYVRCEKCGEMSLEVLGDQELGCEYCLTRPEVEE
jgi:formylmethanofuran dehydrogenase subunit E